MRSPEHRGGEGTESNEAWRFPRSNEGPGERSPTPQELEAVAAEAAEHDSQQQPRIYVACLSSYESGLLHGRWVDADQPASDLQAEVVAMLASSPVTSAEEWAIHDFAGFQGFEIGEHEDLEVISRVADGITRHGEPFAAYLGWAGTSDEAVDHFDDHYMGTYPSAEAWARDVAEDRAWERDLDEALDPTVRKHVSIDYRAFAQQMVADGWHTAQGENGVHVFAP